MVGVSDPALALDFDFAIAYTGAKFDAELQKKARRQADAGADPGEKGETDFWRTVNKVRMAKGLPPALKRMAKRG